MKKGRDAWVCRVIDQVGDYKILKASRQLYCQKMLKVDMTTMGILHN